MTRSCARPAPLVPPGVRGRDVGVDVPDVHPAERVVLALRVALPVLGHEDPDQVRVAVEAHPEEVVDLALVPVGRGPHAGHRGDVRVVDADPDLDPQPHVVVERVEVVVDAEPLPQAGQHRLERLGRLEGGLGPGAHPAASSRVSFDRGSPFRIFSCSRMMPSMSISGRGGQPGTYMSTGTILSTPWTIA